ncbi:MAG: hypothetical protein R3F59_23750 [Myxococcota bacterium]
MSDDAEASVDAQADLLEGLVRELERRARIEDPENRRALDVHIAELCEQVGLALDQGVRTDTGLAPPRRVAVAFGLALHSAPHFAATIPVPARDGTVDPEELPRREADPAPVVSFEVYERALGLGQWEVDELREEIDRRAGKVLKQIRTVNWLWSFFGLPASGANALARILMPGMEDVGVDLVRRGGHLYLLVDDVQPSPLPALFLPWLATDATLGPTSFQARGVDRGLRNRIARGIGADDDEVAELLEEMVSVLPRRGAAPFLQVDQWRSYGYAVVTDLGTAYTWGDWLIRAIPPDSLEWRSWLKLGSEGITVKGTPEKVFDALALPRVTAMVRLMYTSMLASLDRDVEEVDIDVRPEDVDLYDVPRHMRAVLGPMFAWAGRSSTHKHLARELDRPVEEVMVVMEQVREAWVRHAGISWYGPPGTKTPSIQTLVLEHLVVLHRSLRHMLERPSDARADHVDLLLLFAAHYLREARLERLWVRSLSDCADGDSRLPPPEDIVGHWFWRSWQRLLDEIELEGAGETSG